MKFCKDCKHARFGPFNTWHCLSPKLGVSLVDATQNENLCERLRYTSDPLNWCGQDGRWFEPKEDQ